MITFIVFYIVLPLTKSFEVNYCRLPCHINNKTVEHIMCTLKHDCSVGPECKVKTKFNYTPELKSFTLDMHNYFRNKVAFGESLGQNKGNLPQAADMLELVWDEELAYFAQCYANKCILQYDKCRQNAARENIGQLIFIRVSVNPKSTEEIISEMLESVYYGSKVMPSQDVESYRDNKYTKQFTQLVWAKTNRVGCGFTKLLDDLFAFFMVCNYGPAGNVKGEEVYHIGSTCSGCPDGKTCGIKFYGLCAATEDEKRSSREKIEIMETLEHVLNAEEEGTTESNEIDTVSSSTELQRPYISENAESNVETITPPTGTKFEVLMSEIPTFDTSYFSYEEVTTDEESQMIEDLSTSKKRLMMFERLVTETYSEKIATAVTVDEEVPMRSCKVKRRYNWLDLDNQDNGSQHQITYLSCSSISLILLSHLNLI